MSGRGVKRPPPARVDEEEDAECLTTFIPIDVFDAVLARNSGERASDAGPHRRGRKARLPIEIWSMYSAAGLDLSAEAARCPLVQSDSPAAWLAHLEAPASCCCAAGGAPPGPPLDFSGGLKGVSVADVAGTCSKGVVLRSATAAVGAMSARAKAAPAPTAANLPARATAAMTAWLASPENFESPYPTEEERRAFAAAGGITERQVMYWFSNARRRVWKREYVAAGHDAPPPGRRKKKARGSGV